MQAIVGWQPQHLIVGMAEEACTLSQWTTQLHARVARVSDIIDSELSVHDFVGSIPVPCSYAVGDEVLLRRPEHHQERQPPFESGWIVTSIVAPSSVVIARLEDKDQQKIINVDLLKRNVPGSALASETPVPQHNVPDNEEQKALSLDMVWEPVGENTHPHVGYQLRDNTAIRRPVHYTEGFLLPLQCHLLVNRSTGDGLKYNACLLTVPLPISLACCLHAAVFFFLTCRC